MTILRRMAWALAAIAAAMAMHGPASAQQGADYARVAPLVSTSRTIVGEPIAYPGGGAKITSAIVTLAPGERTGRHKHGAPTYGYILSGAVTVDYDGHGRRVYKAGTAFMEAMDVWHDGVNAAGEPCRILVVFMSSETAPNVIRK